MTNRFIFILLLSVAVMPLAINNEIHDLNTQVTHQKLLSITSPCSSGKIAYDKCKAFTPNGCGSGSTQAKISSTFAPYSKKMTSCCNTHDRCFAKCGTPNFQNSFNTCNRQFLNCMQSKCRRISKNKVWWKRVYQRKLCRANAYTFWSLVKYAGRYFYQQGQKHRCGCHNPASGPTPNNC